MVTFIIGRNKVDNFIKMNKHKTKQTKRYKTISRGY